jgi:hypothetical protein
MPALAANLGLVIEDQIGYTQTRRLLANIVHLYKTKGTLPGIAGITSAVTGWRADVSTGPNLVLLRDLVAQAPASAGLQTGVVTNNVGEPVPPPNYNGGVPSAVFPQQWPAALPVYAKRLPAQAWFAPVGTSDMAAEPMVLTTLLDGNPLHYGIPLTSAINTGAGTTTQTVSASTSFTLEVDRKGWSSAIWGTDGWDAPSSPPPAPDPPHASFAIAQTSLPNAVAGQAYNSLLDTQNAAGPVTWNVTAGTLPPGLQLNANTGEISGTPVSHGAWTFTVTASERVIETVLSGQTCAASVWVWSGAINPAPSMALQVHFWGAYGADLGISTTATGSMTTTATGGTIPVYDRMWTNLSLENVSIPVNAVWASLEIVVSAPSALDFVSSFGSSNESVLLAAMPLIEIGSGLPPYTNPRDIQIDVHPDRTNLVANPSFETGATTDWTATYATLSAFQTDHASPPVANPGNWSGRVTCTTAGSMYVDSAPMAVDPTERYSASVYVRSVSGSARTVWLSYIWLDHLGVVLRQDDFQVGSSTSNWAQVQTPSVTPPATAVAGYMAITWSGVVVGEIHGFDCALFEAADSPGEYFDGSSWAGVARGNDFLWNDPFNFVGPSYYYANRLAKIERLQSVLDGVVANEFGDVDPFSITGFVPMGATYTIASDQLAATVTVGTQAIPETWGVGRWGTAAWGATSAVQAPPPPPTSSGGSSTSNPGSGSVPGSGGPGSSAGGIIVGPGSQTSPAPPPPTAGPAVQATFFGTWNGAIWGQDPWGGTSRGTVAGQASLYIAGNSSAAYQITTANTQATVARLTVAALAQPGQVSSGTTSATGGAHLSLSAGIQTSQIVSTSQAESSSAYLYVTGFGTPTSSAAYTGASFASLSVAEGQVPETVPIASAHSVLAISSAIIGSETGWGYSTWGTNTWGS